MMTPQKLQEKLTSHRLEVTNLLNKYQIFSPVNVQTIMGAHNQYGQRFTNELARIISRPPVTTSRNLAAFDDGTTGTGSTGTGSGNFWDTLNTLITYGYQIYQNEKGGDNSGQVIYTPPENIGGIDTRTVVIGLGALMVLLVVVMIFKK